MGIIANSEDLDEMQHNAAFHQGMHCLLKKFKQTFTDRSTPFLIKSYLEMYKMNNSILMASIYIGKAIKPHRLKEMTWWFL